MSDIEITKITVKIGKKEVELTVEQARELRVQLDGLLGVQYPTVYIPSVWYPNVIQPPYTITCGDTTDATTNWITYQTGSPYVPQR